MSFILKRLNSIDLDTIENKENNSMLSKDNDVKGMDMSYGGTKNDSFLSADAFFKGSINFKSFLRIDGQYEGEIASKGTLFVGKTGAVKAEIKVGNIIVEGKVYGNVEATEKIELKENAQLFGDIKASKLLVAEGVAFVGNCNVNPQGEKLEANLSIKKNETPSIEEKKDKPTPKQ
jgi:cytoskeletal protein CcmA (bactofilin family)